MALKIRKNNTSILDTFNDEDIQKEYDAMKLPIIADNIFDAYKQYLQFKSMDICSCYKPKALYELQDWIKQQNDDKRVKVLDVNWIDVSDMTKLSHCFYSNDYRYSYDFTEIKGLENWDVSNVTMMSYMFWGCDKLEILDLSNWDVRKVTDMKEMFCACRNLTEIKGIEDWDVSNVINMAAMFEGCNQSIIPSWYPYAYEYFM